MVEALSNEARDTDHSPGCSIFYEYIITPCVSVCMCVCAAETIQTLDHRNERAETQLPEELSRSGSRQPSVSLNASPGRDPWGESRTLVVQPSLSN